ncbi:MAG: FAD-dependent oxidoreductase [Phycisphaerales bacterium]|nr:MAG: FAD-dependent oxidoreductase [Phycisphaerales bacterium]
MTVDAPPKSRSDSTSPRAGASPQHIIVVGGGVVGVSSAYELAARGARVTLIDRDGFDQGASTGNAGIIALGHPPLQRPGLVKQTLRMFLNPSNPLYIPPRLDADLLRWFWNFRRACSQAQFEHAMRVLTEMGWLAGECFDALVDGEQLDCEYHRTGWMEIFRTPDRMEQGREEAELVRSYGYNVSEYDGNELREREPAIRDDVIGAFHYTDSRFANPRKFVVELARAAEKRGVQLRTGVTVQRVIVDDGIARGVSLTNGESIDADVVVLACGIWTRDMAQQMQVNVPMQPGKGYHVNLTEPRRCPTTVCVCSETFVAVTPIEGGLRLAGTLEFSGINHRMVQRRIDMLRIAARDYLHDLDSCTIRSTWCGLRPCTADGLPVIGWAPGVRGAFIATGHAMMGFALGPPTGRLVAEAITGEKTSMDLAPFSPDRYQTGHRSHRSTAHAGQ